MASDAGLPAEPAWPAQGELRCVFLLDLSSALERRLLEDWMERQRPESIAPHACQAIDIPPTRRRRRVSLARLEACLAEGGDCLLAPLRVAWLPPERGGRRAAHFSDLLKLGDPRDPGPLRQQSILRRHPDRCRIVAGEPAPASELRDRWQRAGGSGNTAGLAEFVARQAALALERAERGLRGARYKVPRLVHEDILGRPALRGGCARLARELGRNEAAVAREAARDLREIAATHSPLVIDLVANLIRWLYTRGYGEALYYDRAQLEQLERLCERFPVVFLPSHKSNLDHLVLQYMLHENGHPPNHTAGGINMNFFPVGPLVRRSGVFFIRRSFKDDPVYKFVLRSYIDYLVEKRFSLEWYIEGGRSRSGKLLPPRFGLLAYVVDAYRRGASDDVMLVPVSIAYDQIQDVGDYANEQSGAPKERESFGWFVRVVRRLRRRYGHIHIRFGEPLSLAKVLGQPDRGAAPNPDEESLAVQKLAFEVAVRINRETPVTPTSLVTLALLGTGDRALTLGETTGELRDLLAYVHRRRLPCTGELELEDALVVQRALAALVENGVVSRFSGGREPVYRIGPEQQLAAAYYRNTVIHFFVNGAIAELALLRAAEAADEPVAAFWGGAMALRDLLKFEFFFADKEVFRGELRRELALHDGAWEARLAEGGEPVRRLLSGVRPFSAHRVLRPFLEAYRLVGDLLETRGDVPVDEGEFVSEATGLGRQYLLQRRIRSAASISQVLIRTGLRLADNRGLLRPDPGEKPAPAERSSTARPQAAQRGAAERSPTARPQAAQRGPAERSPTARPQAAQRGPAERSPIAEDRAAFAEEIRTAIRRSDAIEALDAARRAGIA